MLRALWGLGLISWLVATSMATAMPLDVTDAVRARTDLPSRIHAFCRENCLGNRREGKLKSVMVELTTAGEANIRMRADLRNRQTRGLLPYDYTVVVNGFGKLDLMSCVLRVEAIRIAGDKLGILDSLLRLLHRLSDGVRGKEFNIPDCRAFVPGS